MSDIYNKIEYYRKIRGIPKMKFYELLSLSQAGYRNMVANDTISKNMIMTAAQVLSVPLFVLLENEHAKVLEAILSEQTKKEGTWQLPTHTDMSLFDEIVLSGLPTNDKFLLLSEKIKHLTIQLKIADALADVRKRKIEEFGAAPKSVT